MKRPDQSPVQNLLPYSSHIVLSYLNPCDPPTSILSVTPPRYLSVATESMSELMWINMILF